MMCTELIGYTPQEIENIENEFKTIYGTLSDNVLHDTKNLAGIHIDLMMTEPTEQDPFRRIFTVGAGAYKMPNGISAEYTITLPKDWPMDFASWRDKSYYWPFKLLYDIAQFPIVYNAALNYGEIFTDTKPYADNTALCSCVLLEPEKRNYLNPIPDQAVRLFQIIPLYQEELTLIEKLGFSALISGLQNQSNPWDMINLHRKNIGIA